MIFNEYSDAPMPPSLDSNAKVASHEIKVQIVSCRPGSRRDMKYDHSTFGVVPLFNVHPEPDDFEEFGRHFDGIVKAYHFKWPLSHSLARRSICTTCDRRAGTLTAGIPAADGRGASPNINLLRSRAHRAEKPNAPICRILSQVKNLRNSCFARKKHGEQSSLHFFHYINASTAAPTITALTDPGTCRQSRRSGFRIVSGFGEGVGPYVVNGILSKLERQGTQLLVFVDRPF
jgi:hypothetical protein